MTKRAAKAASGQTKGSLRVSSAMRRSPRGRIKNLLALLFLMGELVVAALLIVGLAIFYRFSSDLPNVNLLSSQSLIPAATSIWSEDGVLLGTLQQINRKPVPLNEISPFLKDATIAIEDHRFYHHFGIDIKGILRAAYIDLTGGNPTREGASTLTQQLVRNVGIFGLNHQKSYARKIREALIAMRVEQLYSKDEILDLYLNNVYYGAGAYGVEAAARTYFGKSAADLDLSQAALLAGLPQLPSAYSPFSHPDRAIERRDEVLDAMLRYGYINRAQYEAAKSEQLHFATPPRTRKGYNFKAPYFVWYVLNDLIRRYGLDFVESGLKIQTTLNWKMQQAAEKALEQGLERASYTGANQGCLVCLDNSNGAIRAMVGGRSFLASQFNIVTQGLRQPGSTFKLFDYAAAFDTGKADLNTTFRDEPIVYPNSHKLVHDFENYTGRSMTCKEAIARSVNTIAVQVAELVGIKTVIAYAHRMGITTPIAPYYPSAIGASAVHPLDLCVAYSVVANNGILRKPMALLRVTDAEGNIVEEHFPQEQDGLLRKSTIDQLNEAFEAVVTEGTGVAARGDDSNGIVPNAHGKTGTTSDFRDAWFAGYTPELTTVIWCGRVHHGRYLPMSNGQGGVVCAPIWHDFMIKAVPIEQKYLAALNPAPPAPQPKPASPKPAPQTQPAQLQQPSTPSNNSTSSASPTTAAPTPSAPSSPLPSNSQSGGTSLNNTGSPIPPTPTNPSTPNSNDLLPSPQNVSTPPATNAPTPSHLAPNHIAAPPTPPKHKSDPMVTVTICVDSHEKATIWCPATITVQMPASQARKLKTCTLHKPPPGAG
ncbi:transglycosylase domain-containing protein [Chthonomonas calidirosea]|uniref:transglycosylase domain-containing protein n=1 Tax=Chthonomonas calidirosea TaxID=454171 RepID=UPI0006ECB941|nr:PBP1A family penicillin-binding protein [Chthonomonas calidirosea]CEK19813.1 penicillin-binding protein, 1A family [Chthonomonas calidirosea]